MSNQPNSTDHKVSVIALDAQDLKAKLKRLTVAEDVRYIDVSILAAGMTVGHMTNILNVLYSRQYVLNLSWGEPDVLHITEDAVNYFKSFPPASSGEFSRVLGGLTRDGQVRGFMLANAVFTMTFPIELVRTARLVAYATLMAHILRFYRTVARVRPVYIKTECERYMMLPWLVQIGLGSTTFKMERKILLERLTGYCSFDNEAEAKRRRDMCVEQRHTRKRFYLEAERRSARGSDD